MKKELLFSIFFIGQLCIAQTAVLEKESSRNTLGTTGSNAIINKTYQEPTNSSTVKDWNTQDWKGYFQKNGVIDTGLISKSQNSLSNIQGSDIAFGANPNQINSETLRKNESLNDVKSLQSFNQELQDVVTNINTTRTTNPINIELTTKCYIAREMPIRFKCDKTGLVYGAGINTGGTEAKRLCDSECYEQYSCVDVNPTASESKSSISDMELLGTEEYKEITHVTNGKIESISFNADVIKDSVYMDILITSLSGKEQSFTKKMILKNESFIIPINLEAKSVRIKIYGSDTTSAATITNISVNYKIDSKYICPLNQDLSTKNPGDFAYLCPSGKIKTFAIGTNVYKICEDYGLVGDNSDGTFSSFDGCKNSCKTTYNCKMDTTSIATASLQNFREGCLEGQANCKIDTCRQLRINQNQIINENVFFGDFKSHPTIISNALVEGIERPKILLSEDVDFQTRSKEEWKDGAYSNMVSSGSYRVSSVSLDEDTQKSSAYNMGVTNNSTSSATGTRGLFWVLKPKALDVDNSTLFKHYAVLEVVADRLVYDLYGKQTRTKDKIIYVKTNANDTFKPIAIKRDFAKKDSNAVEDSEVLTSVWKYEYFNSGLKNWYSHGSSNMLEYFKNEKFLIDGPYNRIEIVSNYNGLMYQLPGLIRSIKKNGPYETISYEGLFDGTGHVVTQLKLYVDYSNSSLYNYSEVIENIENGDWKAIYNNTSADNSVKTVTSDTLKESDGLTYHNKSSKLKEDIEVYMYGSANSKSSYARIKPKTEDVGKKAFIFIFAQ